MDIQVVVLDEGGDLSAQGRFNVTVKSSGTGGSLHCVKMKDHYQQLLQQ